MKRAFLARTLGVFSVLVLASCFGDSTGPGELRRAWFSVAPVFDQTALRIVPVDRVHIVLHHSDGSVALDTTVTFPANVDTLELSLEVQIKGATETLDMDMSMLDASGTVVFQAPTTSVVATTALGGGQPVAPVLLYVGPGANAVGVRFLTAPTAVFFGQTVTFTAEAFDQNNVTVPNAPLSWSSSDPTRASVPNPDAGQLVAGTARGGVTVTASLLKTSATTAPANATTPLLVQPVANRIVVQAGNNQSGPIAGQLSQPITARVLAADNLGVFGVTVTFAVTTGGGTVNPVTSISDASGDAPTIWTLGTAIGAQTLTATASGVTGSTANFNANGTPGLPAKVAFLQQPTNVGANATMSPAVTVLIQDVAGNTVTTSTASVTLAIGTNPGGASLTGGVTVNAVAGVATFNSLTLNSPGTGYTLVATSGSLTNATSTAFNVTGGVPAALAFSVQPSSAVAGVAIAPAIQVAIQDANGITIPTATNTVTLAIASNPASGTLSGTVTVAAVAGIATFSTVSIDKAGSGYTLAATSGTLTAATSTGFNITPAAATTLAFGVQPPSAVGQNALFTVAVVARDNFGNAVTTFTGNVTVAIATNPAGGTLGGTTTVVAASGLATFGNLTIDNVGTGYTLTATSGALGSATSNPFDVGVPASFKQWINPASGNWSQPSNWSGGTVPGPNDTVAIVVGGTYTVTVDQDATVPVIFLGGGSGTQTLALSGNTLTVTGVLSVGPTAVLAVSGGTLTGGGSGQFAVQGQMLHSGGTVSAAHIALPPGAELYLSGFASLNSDTLVVAGELSVGLANNIGLNSGTLVDILPGGLFEFDQAGDNVSHQFGNAPLVTVAAGATMDLNVAPGIVSLNVPLVMNGTMQMGGTVNLSNTVTVGGSVQAAASAFLNNFGTTTFLAGSNLSGAGALSLNSGTLTIGGTYGLTGNVLVQGGTLLYNGATPMTVGTLGLHSGTVGGSGQVTVSTTMDWTDGQLGGQDGTLILPSGAVMQLSTTGAKSIVQHTVQVGGQMTLAAGPAMTLGMNSGAQLVVSSGGQIDIAGDHSLQNQFGAAPMLTVQTGGQLTRSAGTGTMVFNVPVTMNGTMLVNTGTLSWLNASSVTGAVTMGTGTTLVMNGTHAWNTGSAVTGPAEVQVPGGSLTTGGTAYGLTGPLRVLGGQVTLNNSALLSLATVELSGGSLRGTGQLRVTGDMTWTSGTLGSNSGTLIIPAGVTLTVATAASKDIQNHTLQVAGTMAVTSAATVLGINSAAVLEVQSGGLLQLQGDNSLQHQFGGVPLLHLMAGSTMSPTGSGTVSLNVPMSVDGTMNFPAGILNWGNNVLVNGTVTMGATSQLILNGGFTFAATSTLSGPTGLQLPGGSVSMAGTYGLTGLLQISGGTFNVNAAAPLTLSQVQLASGVLNNTSQLNIASLDWSGGTLGGSNGLVAVSGTLAISGAASKNMQATQLDVAGAVTLAAGTSTLGVNSGAQWRLLSGAVFDIDGDNAIDHQFGGTPLFTVSSGATLRRNAGAGTLRLNLPMVVDGTFQLFTGNLDWQNTVTVNGTVQLSTGTISTLIGTHAWLSGANVTGQGEVRIPSGQVTTDGTSFGLTGQLRIQGGTLVFNNTTGRTLNNLELSSGQLRGTGTLTATGTMTWSSGTIGNDGGTLVVPGASTLALTTTAGKSLQTHTISLGGTLSLAGVMTLGLNSGAQVDVNSGGLVDIVGDINIDHQFGGVPLLFVHPGGTLTRSGSSGTARLNVPMQMQGAMTLATGTLQWQNSVTVGGTVSLAAGTLTQINGSNSWASSASVTGGGDIEVPGGLLSLVGATAFSGAGSLTVNGGIAQFDNSAPLSLGVVHLTSGQIRGSGEVHVNTGMTWQGGTLGGVGSKLVIDGPASLSVSTAAAKSLNDGTLEVAGSMTLQSGGAFTLGMNNGARLRVLSGGSVSMFDDHTLSYQFGTSPSLEVLPGGSLFKGVSAGTATVDVALDDQGGLISVGAGTLSFTRGGNLDTTAQAVAGALLRLGGGDWGINGNWNMSGDFDLAGNAAFEHLNGHTAHVTGSFTLGGTSRFSMATGDSLIVGGALTMNSTNSSTQSGGTLVVGGDFTQTNTGLFRGLNHHATVFNGAAQQTISVGTGSRFAVLRPDNPGNGITIVTDVVVTDTLNLLNMHTPFFGPSGRVILSSSTANPNAASMIDTSVISPIFLGTQLVLRGQPVQIGNAIYGLTIDSGNVAPAGSWNVNNLTVSGGVFDATTPNGDISVAADLLVDGSGVLNMGYPTALNVGGTARFHSSAPNTGLTEGTLTIGGNFEQTGNAESFAASGNHLVLFSGSAASRTIFFTNPGSGAGTSHFAGVTFNDATPTSLNTDFYTNHLGIFQGAVSGPHRLSTNGNVTFGGSGASLTVRSFETHGGVSSDGLTYSADTTVFDGSDYTVPFLPYGSVLVPGAVNWSGADIAGDLVISGSVNMNDNSITVGGNLATVGGGILMTPNGEELEILGNATFGGGDETGQLDFGRLVISGNFQQTGATATSFATGPGFDVFMAGGALQTISFANPSPRGAGGSQFGNLVHGNTSSAGVRLLTRTYVGGQFRTNTANLTRLIGPAGDSIVADDIDLNDMQIDSVLLVVRNTSGGGAFQADNVTFGGYDPTLTQFLISQQGQDMTFNGLTFNTPTTGAGNSLHLRAIDTDGVANFLTIHLLGTTPTSATAHFFGQNGAFVDWQP